MKKTIIMVFAVVCYFVSSENIAYASSSDEKIDRLERVIDVFEDEDDDHKDKKDKGNSKNGKDNHGQNKKK